MQVSDEPLDIGIVELKIKKRLKVGRAATLFEVETLNGEPLNLADYSGKVVLLVFAQRATFSYNNKDKQLKEIYNAFGKNKQFAMIGLWSDSNLETVKEFVRENELEWIHGLVDVRSESSIVIKDYEVDRFPYTFLIGPDGKIIAGNPSDTELRSAISQALGK